MEATEKRLRFAWSLDSCEKGKMLSYGEWLRRMDHRAGGDPYANQWYQIESAGQEALLNDNVEQCTCMQTEDCPLEECFCNVSSSGDRQAKYWEPRSGESNIRMDVFNSRQRVSLFPFEEEADDLTERDNIQ